MRILIVDNDKVFASALAQLVGVCQHEVVDVVSSGLEAIRSYQQNKPDLVLMDFGIVRMLDQTQHTRDGGRTSGRSL